MSERPAKRARHEGPDRPRSGAPQSAGEETIARPRKFQDFAATHQGVVAEHVASLLATRDVKRLACTAPELKDAGALTFKLWRGSGERMGKAIAALEAKREAARAEAKAKLAKAIAALGPKPEKPNEYGNDDGDLRTTWRQWNERLAPLRKAIDA